jgi:hypothetical protein
MLDSVTNTDRRAVLWAAAGLGLMTTAGAPRMASAQASAEAAGPLDARSEARKIAFDRAGHGEKVLLISGFPQTRRSWNRLIPLLSQKFEAIPADLLSISAEAGPGISVE